MEPSPVKEDGQKLICLLVACQRILLLCGDQARGHDKDRDLADNGTRVHLELSEQNGHSRHCRTNFSIAQLTLSLPTSNSIFQRTRNGRGPTVLGKERRMDVDCAQPTRSRQMLVAACDQDLGIVRNFLVRN